MKAVADVPRLTTTSPGAVAPAPIGIDAEWLDRPRLEAACEYLDAAERAALGQGERRGTLALWCAKEAVAKSLGQGLNGRPKSFVIAAFDGTSAVIETPDGARRDAVLARTETAVMALSLAEAGG